MDNNEGGPPDQLDPFVDPFDVFLDPVVGFVDQFEGQAQFVDHELLYDEEGEDLESNPAPPGDQHLADFEQPDYPEPEILRDPVATRNHVIQSLHTCFENGDFEGFKTTLMSYLCKVVPLLFVRLVEPMTSAMAPLEVIDKEKVVRFIIGPLECTLLGRETEDFAKAVAETDVPNGSCARVFKSGESTYSCRDCGADPTCVLCNDCFNHSEHKNHRYRISTSHGGGYCDCGDTEAWKEHALCAKHRHCGGSGGCKLKSKEQRLAEWVFQILLHYADGILSELFHLAPRSIPVIRDYVKDPVDAVVPYSLLLYNDEVHTFEIVIHALTRALLMDKKQAAAFTNKIHHDGRAVVRTTTFDICLKLSEEIDRITRQTSRPLRVQIHQSALVAHQQFAEYVLDWITGLLNKSSSYRHVFYSIASKRMPDSNRTFLQTFLLNDTKGWKHVRGTWHHLLIAGILKEYEIKKHFATVFAEAYGDLMTEFSQDDHDHAFSVTSLSVQIFTVPSISRFLIERGIFSNVMRTILSEVEPRVQDGKLHYERTGPGPQMRITQYCLLDLKYLLTSVPQSWTPELSKSFLYGFYSLVRLCVFVQESDPVVRQLVDHVEFDADWELAFNIHARLAPVLILVCDWCAGDQLVTLKCFMDILRNMRRLETKNATDSVLRELANHSATCYVYDVSRRPISIYLALTRLYAGMFLIINGHYQGTQLETTLHGIPMPTPEYMMEGPLRTLTLVAQRHAGMWRRNGLSLLNQVYFYQDVRCRVDMFDKDLLAMQIASTQIESNEFLIHIMNKYNVIQWVDERFDSEPPNDDDTFSYTVLLADEFLLLILQLINGRFVPGVSNVTREDCIRKQVIQYLCIGPMTHSELNRHLEENIHGETGIDEVIKDVAELKKSPKGDVYELRPECYAEYDAFYYHYVRDEIAKAEEAQRARKLALKEPDVFPPPILPRLAPCFTLVINLLQSDVMLFIFQTVIKRFLKQRSRSFSDVQLRKVLHLIGYGLNEELESRKIDPVNFFQFAEALYRFDVVNLLQSAMTHPRAGTHKEMILWLIYTHDKIRPSVDPSSALRIAELKEAEEKELRKQKAAAARARSMASMSNLQMKFRSVNADLFEEHEDAEEACETNSAPEPVCLGPTRTAQSVGEELTCILCMDKTLSSPLVVGCFIQRSNVLAQKMDSADWNQENLEFEAQFIPRPDFPSGLFIGSCGHVMHKSCWSSHHTNLLSRERNPPFRPFLLFDNNRSESLCPMCECLMNTVLPVLTPPALATIRPPTSTVSCSLEFEDWVGFLLFTVKNVRLRNVHRNTKLYWDLPSKDIIKHDAVNMFWPNDPTMPTCNENPMPDDDFLFRIEQESQLRTINVEVRGAMLKQHTALVGLWSAIAYTITSFELSTREQEIPFFGTDVPYRVQLTMKYLTRAGAGAVNTKDPAKIVAVQFIAVRTAGLMCFAQNSSIIELAEIDPFSLLVMATFSLPFLYANSCGDTRIKAPLASTRMDTHIFRAVFFLHMAQLLSQQMMLDIALSAHNSPKISPAEGDYERFCRKIWKLPSCSVPWAEVMRRLEELVVPFVTCCCKFYECYTAIDTVNFLPQNTSLTVMLKYLGQSTDLETFFTSPLLLDFGYSYTMRETKKGNLFPRSIMPLTQLPTDYLDLMNVAAEFACETNRARGTVSRHPTLCLICGKLLCSQSPCCVTSDLDREVGACNFHMRSCGLGTGLFLRIRDCKAFVLAADGSKGTYEPPPYVDDYGETDQGLRRGNPLQFSVEKYAYLRKLWINHSIPEEIVRMTDRNGSLPSVHYINWTQL